MELLIEVTEPKIYQNFEEVKTDLIESTKKYEIEVTVDNLTEAKKAGADINKIKANIKSRAKVFIDTMEAPIIEFKTKLKELEAVLDGRRLMITKQVTVFEDVKRAAHVAQMNAYLVHLVTEHGLDLDRAKKLDVTPFASVAGMTSKGKLNAKSRGQVEVLFSTALDEQKVAEVEAENKRLKDEARAEEIIRERVEKAKKEDIAAGIEAVVGKPVTENPETPAQYNEVTPQAAETPEEVIADRQVPESVQKPTSGKSIYRITMTYEITSQAGGDLGKIQEKVVPMITAGQVPVTYIKTEEVL